MRYLAIILQLALAAVILVATAAACYTVADPSAGYATPIDPSTLGDRSRGVVIEGICPAEVEPATVSSDSRSSYWGHDGELRATAYADKVVLNWETPDVPRLTGYIVYRSRDGTDFDNRVSIYRVDEVADIGQEEQYVDSDGIEVATWYGYQVFPVTPDGVGVPSAWVTIWTPPEEPPPAPSYVNARRKADGEVGIGIGFGYHAWQKGVRIARRPSAESAWRIVHEEPPENGRDHRLDEHRYWADTGDGVRTAHQYAVCVSNASGYGRATVSDVAAVRAPVPVSVGPPRNIRSVASRDGITVYWDPLYDKAVTGYEMEMEPCAEGHSFTSLKSNNAHQNHASCGFSHWQPSPVQRTRVRATTNDGPGPWSDYFEADASFAGDDESEDSLPEVVSLSASSDKVFGVWKTGGGDVDIRYLWNRQHAINDVEYRILRRRADLGGEYEALDRGVRWVDLDSFDWDEQRSKIDLEWHDDHVQPDTEYEYAVQLKSGDTVHPPSGPKIVRTAPLPKSRDRRPLWVQDFNAIPTDRGFELTWDLPDDPTLTGLQLISHCDGAVGPCYLSGPVLPRDATSYLAVTDDYNPHVEYCFWLRTINDYGLQSTWGKRLCVDGGELSHCQRREASVERRGGGGGFGLHYAIELLDCEVSQVRLIRRELTADGFEVKEFNTACPWSSFPIPNGWPSTFDGTDVLSWRYADYDIKPGRWYVYEMHQIFGNGSMSVNFSSVVSPYGYRYEAGDQDPCARPPMNRAY